MFAKVHSYILSGIDALPCEVEVDLRQTQSLSDRTVVVGLPQTAVKESIERVYRAIGNSGFQLPTHAQVVNLAPADQKKDGPALDLPIALGILACAGAITTQSLEGLLIAGELALDGSIRRVKGGLPMALLARQRGASGVVVPAENAAEAAVVEGIRVYPVKSLTEAVRLLSAPGEAVPFSISGELHRSSAVCGHLDFSEVKGQAAVKRAITVAAAGMHNILMIGPPGTGKTMLAQRIPGILPNLEPMESLETTRVYSAMGLLPEGVSLMDQRPVRTPHHSCTAQALIGGGTVPKPGEVSLAHNGILFLDELPEFSRYALEMLRQPLEGGEVVIGRVHGSVRFPARFMLVAAMNPSARGKAGADTRSDAKYMAKLSLPLLDRIDIHVEVPAVPYSDLTSRRPGASSADMRSSVATAREVQRRRFGGRGVNAQMSSRDLSAHCQLDEQGLLIMRQVMEELGLSARAYDKIRRVARTIADMAGSDNIRPEHLTEAVQYRLLDRKF